MNEVYLTICKLFVPKLGWTSLQIPLTIIPPFAIALFNQYVYDDTNALMVLYGMYLLDFTTGVWAAYKEGGFAYRNEDKTKGVTSKKLANVAINAILGTAFLSMAWHFQRHNPNINIVLAIINSTFAGFVYFVLTSQLVLSISENLGRLGVLPKTVIEFMKDKLDLKKLLKIGKKEEKDETPPPPTPPSNE